MSHQKENFHIQDGIKDTLSLSIPSAQALVSSPHPQVLIHRMDMVDLAPGSTASGAGGQPPRRPGDSLPPKSASKKARRRARKTMPCQPCLRWLRKNHGYLVGERLRSEIPFASGQGAQCERCGLSRKKYTPVPEARVAETNRILALNQMLEREQRVLDGRAHLAWGSGADASGAGASGAGVPSDNIFAGIREALRLMGEACAALKSVCESLNDEDEE
ncbi:hypothetical protein AYL99_11615 [Fonsecaea erecta]|uniref:Uncharacterized protein n=1 Tax=Fonsecaea erecta TaxID=1367422 RepID=A0A178Z3H8_9EURO|nr:hypothetical protein AYL99_11615 [Fonsecaea erecta]OAP54081.1 hypothetical protein AYL99_11615 [Fonsecaea erecta]